MKYSAIKQKRKKQDEKIKEEEIKRRSRKSSKLDNTLKGT